MKTLKLFAIFLVVNFGSLAIGGWLMDSGPTTEWYLNLNKAPWTPPGWVFGAAWTFIMLCFSIYLTFLFRDYVSNFILKLFAIQVFLNVIWNYTFFNQHLVLLSLIIIIALTVLIWYFFFRFKMENMNKIRFLLLPYMVWLCIATSLNAYVLLYN